jgi:hypothetical protein
MKREILFRGYSESLNKWVEGNFTYDAIGDSRIIKTDSSGQGLTFIPVHPDSVGQFTSLIDTTKSNIFEGMRVRVGAEFEGIVKFKSGSFIIEDESGKFYFMNELVSHLSFTITGNIFKPK